MLIQISRKLATENSTAMPPLAASIRRYRIENGRTYHAYKDGSELNYPIGLLYLNF